MNNNLNYTLSLKDLFSNKMQGAINATSKLDSKMDSLKSKMGGLSSALVGVFSAGAIIGFGKSVIDSLKNYEYFSASLRVLMHGDRDAAGLLQRQLVQLAKVSPFSLTDVQDSSRKLLAYGFSAKEVVTQMKMLGDISAATGNQIGDVAYLYGTLRTQGKAMTKDLYQFTNRGINVIPLLAKQFGIAESQVYKYAEQGKISFKNIEKAFITMTSKGGDFFGMMDEQSKTVGGRLSNLGDAWEQLKVTIGNSQTGIINSSVAWLSKMVGIFDNFLKNREMMSASFEKYGAQDYTALQKINSFLGLGAISQSFTGGREEDTRYQDSLNKQFVDPSSKSLSQAIKSQQSLSNMIANVYQDSSLDKTSASFGRTVAILKGSLAEVQKNIGVLKKQESGGPLTGDNKMTALEDSQSASASGTEISGSKPQNMYINITKLVENLNITTSTIKESALQVREEMAKSLLEAVNDVNLIAK